MLYLERFFLIKFARIIRNHPFLQQNLLILTECFTTLGDDYIGHPPPLSNIGGDISPLALDICLCSNRITVEKDLILLGKILSELPLVYSCMHTSVGVLDLLFHPHMSLRLDVWSIIFMKSVSPGICRSAVHRDKQRE